MYKTPHSYYIKKVKNYCSQDLIKCLEGAQINKPSKQLLKKLVISTNFNFSKLSKEIIKLNPTDISILTRVLSGHNTLNYHLQHMGYSYHPYCEYCTVSESQIDNDTAEIETATHILCECPAFSTIRIRIYGSYTLTPDQLFSSKEINVNLKNIIKFIKKKLNASNENQN